MCVPFVFFYLVLSSGWACRDAKHMEERVPKQAGGIEELRSSPVFFTIGICIFLRGTGK